MCPLGQITAIFKEGRLKMEIYINWFLLTNIMTCYLQNSTSTTQFKEVTRRRPPNWIQVYHPLDVIKHIPQDKPIFGSLPRLQQSKRLHYGRLPF